MREMEKKVQERLFALQDSEYKAFQCRLMPTVSPSLVIGVRTPALRKLAKQFAKQPEAKEWLKLLPHQYYEENNLHGFLIEGMKDYQEAVDALNCFLPYVDNWATCDMIAPKVFQKHRPELLAQIRRWMASEHPYTIRFGIGMLMRFYLDEAFDPSYLEWVASLQSEEYYVNMMIAWYFATALAKQYDAALPYIEQHRLNDWTHNKAIQKAVESYRITDAQKADLKRLKRKIGRQSGG